MKGILLKDLMTMRKTIALYLIVFVIFAVSIGESAVMLSVIYAIMLPINLIAYDERSRFERLLLMFPVNSIENVLAKYVLSDLFMAIVLLVNAGFGMIGQGAALTAELLFPAVAVGLLMQAVTLPLIFHFGVEKGRMIYIVAIMAMACLMGMFGDLTKIQLPVPSYVLGWAGLAIAAAANAGSIFLSAYVYEKRLTR